MHALDGSIVNLRLRPSQRLEDCNGRLFRALRNGSRRNNLPNLSKPSALRMLVWRGRPRPRTLTTKRFLVPTALVVRMLMGMRMPCPVLFPRQIFFPIDVNIHLGSGNPAAHDAGNFQPRPNSERRHSFFEHGSRNSGIHQRAQKHIAAHAGKTLKVGNAHKRINSRRRHGARTRSLEVVRLRASVSPW